MDQLATESGDHPRAIVGRARELAVFRAAFDRMLAGRRQMVLISGDEDFVPASKLARREGIDFILDPLWNPVDPSLFEHIDGLNSTSPKPIGKL